MASRIIPGISERMNQREKCILKSFKTKICDSVDPVTLVSFLFRYNNIPKELKERVMFLFRSGSSRHDIMRVVLDALPEVINISVLIYALDRTGYKKIATEIFLVARKPFNDAETNQQMPSSSGDRTRLQTLYRNLKRMVHDSQFKNPREALRSMVKRFRSDFEVERDELKRQKLADKCVAILGVELDAHYDSLACKVEISQQEMLMEMKELVPHTTNPLITDTIVYSRQANLDAFHGDFNHAEDMLVAARGSALGVEQCLELVNLLYVEVYVKLWEFETSPSKEDIDTLMMWGRFGLECLNNEHEETRRMWKRMFILRMVFGLLGLGNRGNIIQGYSVDKASISEVQDLLADVDKIWDHIEVRREMFYCIARSRLNELLGLFENAKGYLERAKALAVQGGFLEKLPYIENFMTSIDKRIGQTHSDQSESSSSLNLNNATGDTRAKDLPVGNTISNIMGYNERDAVELQGRDLPCLLKTTSSTDLDVTSSDEGDNIRPYDHRVRQLRTLVKENTVRDDHNKITHMLLLKSQNESNMTEINHEEKVGFNGCEDNSPGQNDNTCPAEHEIKSQHGIKILEALSAEGVLGFFSTTVEVVSPSQNSYKTPKINDFTSSAGDEDLRLNSDQAHRLQMLIKRKAFEGGPGFDIAVPNMRGPDATNVKEIFENYQSIDTTDLKKCESERETSSQKLHSTSVHLEKKNHIDEEKTSPKLVEDSLPDLSTGVEYLLDENGTAADVSNERAKDNIRHKLTHACEEKLQFGSVALYEDRLEPEGASFTGDQQ